MKRDKIIYWVSTGIVCGMMLMSAFMYFTDPKVVEGFKLMGFPDYFRVELGTAKLLGALAGFGINFISAAIAHISIGDTSGITMPLVLLALLIISNIFFHKLKSAIA
jgi:hypothetical protein